MVLVALLFVLGFRLEPARCGAVTPQKDCHLCVHQRTCRVAAGPRVVQNPRGQ